MLDVFRQDERKVVETVCLVIFPLISLKKDRERRQSCSFGARDPFPERPSNLTGPDSDFEIKASGKVGCVLTSNKVHFVSLANNFTVIFQPFETLIWN